MQELKTVLMLSRFFPPGFEIGGKRAYRFARYLPEFGWRAAIITDIEPRGARLDASAGRPLPAVHSIHRCWYPQSWPRPESTDSDGTSSAPTRPRKVPPDAPLERLAWHLAMPFGNEIALIPRMAQLVRRIAKAERAQALFATSSPYSALAFGVAAKALCRLPLHLDLRDPWSMNFLQQLKSPWTRWSETRAEAALLQRADRITLTCDSAAQAYRRRYPKLAPRIGRIFNSFDPAQRPPRVASPQGAIKLVHFGNCYGVCRLDTILKAIARLRDQDGITADKLELHNLGRMAADDLELIDQLDLRAFVHPRSVIPYEQGLALLAAADFQLLLAYGSENLFIPAKLYDYLLTGAPVLCIAPPSELTAVVARTGVGVSLPPGDSNAVAQLLRRSLKMREKPFENTKNEAAIEAFSARTTAKELAAMLDEMLVRRAATGHTAKASQT